MSIATCSLQLMTRNGTNKSFRLSTIGSRLRVWENRELELYFMQYHDMRLQWTSWVRWLEWTSFLLVTPDSLLPTFSHTSHILKQTSNPFLSPKPLKSHCHKLKFGIHEDSFHVDMILAITIHNFVEM